MRNDPIHPAELADTDETIARAVADTHDHMGRRHAATVGEAFAQDWPYVLGVIALLAFVIFALAGYFR